MGSQRKGPLRNEVDLKAQCLNVSLKCLGSQITGVDVAQILLAISHINVKQPVLDGQEVKV